MKRLHWVLLVGLALVGFVPIGSGSASATCTLYDGSDTLADEPTGAIVQETCTTTRATRVTQADLFSGEDQTNNLLMTSGGAVRGTTMASAVTTNTTSAAVAVPTGTKTFYGSVDGTGAVTQTQVIYGGLTSGVTATNGEPICTLTLSGTTHAHGACVSTAPWLFYIVVTTNTTGTGATGAITAMY